MKVRVKKGDLAKLFRDIHRERTVEGRKMSEADAYGRFRRAEDEDGLFSKSWSQPGGIVPSTGLTRPPGTPSIRWEDPAEASGGRKGSAPRDVVQKVYEHVVFTPPQEQEYPELLDDESQRVLSRFHDLHDGLVLCCQLIPGFNPYRSKHFPAYAGMASRLVQKILTTQGGGAASGSGGDFIPNTLSGQLVSLYRQALILAANLPHVNMTDNPMRMPLEGADVVPYYVGEASGDEKVGDASTDAIPTRTPGTAQITFNAKALRVRGLISEEAEEDSIISQVGYMRSKLVNAIVTGVEGAVLDGDDSSTHQDSDVTASTDYRKVWDGLRLLALANAESIFDVGGQVVAKDFLNLFRSFGKFAANPMETLIICGTIAITQLSADTNVVSIDKIGSRAAILTGQVASLWGRPIIVSGQVRENLNASGVYDGSTTDRTYAIAVHRPSFAIGDRKSITVESAKDITTGKHIVVVAWRGDFVQMQTASAGNRPVGILRDIQTGVTIS